MYAGGWAADPQDGSPVTKIEIRIDGVPVGNATLGGQRSDVATSYNDARYASSGWSFSYNIGALAPGVHQVSAVAYDSTGLSNALKSNTPTITVADQPIGWVDGIICTCAQNTYMSVVGWAADPKEGSPITKVEISIDGIAIGNAFLGGQRLDVAAYHNDPRYSSSGWTFTYNIGNLAPGVHQVTATAFNSAGTNVLLKTNAPTINVTADTTDSSRYFRTMPNGTVSVTQSAPNNGEVAFATDDQDITQSFAGQAGSQMHLRVSRAACPVPWNPSSPSNPPHACDLSNPQAQDLLISPYDYGFSVEYPSTLEMWVRDFSVHNNHQGCDPTISDWRNPASCSAGADFWVGDTHDGGGLFATAHDELINGQIDPTRSFAILAADTFQHASHGSLLFQVRNPGDSFQFQSGAYGSEVTQARIDSTGKGYFNGGTQVGGADFAESVSVAPAHRDYTPGDVLVIDPAGKRKFALSSNPYSKQVAGIYSTKPGVLATRHQMSTQTDEIPLAVVGIVPCKVTGEAGPIVAGDLLVTSSTPGHAMKATDSNRLPGAILGKALESFSGDKGMIEVLVSLQ